MTGPIKYYIMEHPDFSVSNLTKFSLVYTAKRVFLKMFLCVCAFNRELARGRLGQSSCPRACAEILS